LPGNPSLMRDEIGYYDPMPVRFWKESSREAS